MREIKNCHSQDSKDQRDATACAIKQYLSIQQMCFLSCLSSANTSLTLEQKPPLQSQTRGTDGAAPSSFSSHQPPWPLHMQVPSQGVSPIGVTCATHVEGRTGTRCIRAPSSSPSLCYGLNFSKSVFIPVALNTSMTTKHQ